MVLLSHPDHDAAPIVAAATFVSTVRDREADVLARCTSLGENFTGEST
jgi:hypothetical protein